MGRGPLGSGAAYEAGTRRFVAGRALGLALSAALAGGCTPPPSTAPAAASTPSTPETAGAPASPSPPAAPSPAPKPARVAVTITGVLSRGPDGLLEICPGESLRPCPGVRVVGELSPALVSSQEPALIVRLTGTYDGAELTVSGGTPVGPGRRSFTPPLECPTPRRKLPAVHMASTAADARRTELERRHPERFAGGWWDRQRGVYTLWFTGELNEAEEPRARDGVCVVGGARYSMRELRARWDQILPLLEELGVLLVGGGPDVSKNRVLVQVENIDQARLARVHAAGAGAVDVLSFIELAADPLEDLPSPPTRGDVPLITSPLRSSYVHMHALGRFDVRLDEAARCVYLQKTQPNERLLPLWPFGYAAYTGPLRIVDFDDVEVARTGEAVAFGGGYLPLPAALRDRACGAESAWSGAPNR
jgi:hypothetical protein